MFFAFHHKAMVIDMKSAFLAERTQMKTPMKGPVIVEIKVHERRAKGHHARGPRGGFGGGG